MDNVKVNTRILQLDLEYAAKSNGRSELGRRIHEALHNDTVDWPPVAERALGVPGLHQEVRYMLIEVAARLVQGQKVTNRTLSLMNLMDRHHPGWR